MDETEQLETNAAGSMDMNDSSMDFSLSSKKKKKKKVIVDVDEEKLGLQLHCTECKNLLPILNHCLPILLDF